MKKSTIVQLGLTSAMAAALLGCGRRQVGRCVDESDRVVDDKLCDEMDRNRSHGFYPVFIPYRWYYGGSGFGLGARAMGGGYAPAPGASTVRGGFGSTGGNSSGSGGGGE